VARVVDASVREDGVNEPVLELASQRGYARVRSPDPEETSTSGDGLVRGLGFTGHPVRDRLLARARAAEQAAAAPEAAPANAPQAPAPAESASEPPAAPEPATEFSSLQELADDLDLIGTRGPEPVSDARPSLPLSPLTSLLLVTLFGVTALASLFAVLIHVAPRGGVAPAPSEPASPIATLAPTPSAQPPPPVTSGDPAGSMRRPPRKPMPAPWRIADAAQDAETIQLSGTIGSRSFLDAAKSAGLRQGESFRALAALKDSKNLDRCRPKDSFIALVERSSGKLKAFEYVVGPEEVYQAREGADGLLRGGRIDLRSERQRVLGAVQVLTTFDESAKSVGFEPGLPAVVDRALEGYTKTADLAQGEVLRMVAQELTVLGDFSRYTGIEALEYRPRSGEPLRLYYMSTGDVRGYVDAKGRRFGRSRWTSPVKDVRITSRFNPRRFHPILKRIRPHNGTDFAAPIGTPVMAAAAGTVSYVGRAGPNGNLIKIDHAGGIETGYSHLSRFAKGLRVGTKVTQRQIIGLSGSTGRSTGPHLHFSAKRNGRFIDAETLRLDELTRLPPAERELMDQLRQRYDAMLDSIPLPPPVAAQPEPQPELPAAGAEPAEPGDDEGDGDGDSLPGIAAQPSGPRTRALVPASMTLRHAERIIAEPAALGRGAPQPVPVNSGASSIYLSDKELMRRQPETHDGEVE
jgi:murein DD-endopeptidase MepM/ murein hydrolase activator NlpD